MSPRAETEPSFFSKEASGTAASHCRFIVSCALPQDEQCEHQAIQEDPFTLNLERKSPVCNATCGSSPARVLLQVCAEESRSYTSDSSCFETNEIQGDEKTESQEQCMNIWLHPIHGLPCDSNVRAFPVKLAEGGIPCHCGVALLRGLLTTVGIRCTCVNGFLEAANTGIAIPLLHATIAGVADAPGNRDLVVFRLIEASHEKQSNVRNEWLVICKREDRLAVLDCFSTCGCSQSGFSEQYTLQMDKLLGSGASGMVYAAKKTSTFQNVAAKLLQGKASDENRAREVRFLCAVGRHENVVRFLGIFDNVLPSVDSQACCLLFDHYTCGDLHTRILNTGPFQGEQAMQAITSLLIGLSHIHKLGIVHRQLSPENCLVCDGGTIVLSGFGSAAFVTEQELLMERVGSLGFAAPEVYKRQPQDMKTDMFIAGITLFLTLSGQHPFMGPSPTRTVRRTLTGKVNWTVFGTADVNQHVRDLLASLLTVNQHTRPSADDALQQFRSWRMA